ncbi:MAG: hypothetical protein SGPRY_000989 [Prymnesium sp.]
MGVRMERVPLDLTIRPGMAEGTKFRIRGTPDKAAILIILRQKQHSKFKRAGDNLVVGCELTLFEALTGFRRCIRQLDGQSVWITDGEVTRPGQLKRLRGFGMPILNARVKGDLLVSISRLLLSEQRPVGAEAARLLRQVLPRTSVPSPRDSDQLHRLEAILDDTDQNANSEWGM